MNIFFHLTSKATAPNTSSCKGTEVCKRELFKTGNISFKSGTNESESDQIVMTALDSLHQKYFSTLAP